MGFLFYITDFWYWRWRELLSRIPGLMRQQNFLQTYYVNFYFVITDVPLLRRLGWMIEQIV